MCSTATQRRQVSKRVIQRPGGTSSRSSHVRSCSVRYQKRCAPEAPRRANKLTSSNDHLVSANQGRPARAIACAHGKKVLAYEAITPRQGGETMRRREFIGLLGGAAGALTYADVFAAQKSPMARIGYLIVGGLPTECCVTPECKSLRWEACQFLCPPCLLVSRFACVRLARRREFADRATPRQR